MADTPAPDSGPSLALVGPSLAPIAGVPPGQPPGSLLDAAAGHYEFGHHAEAERLCQQVLSGAPDDPGALNLLAAIAFDAGRPDLARQHLDRATAAAHPSAVCLLNLGLVLNALGQPLQALEPMRRACSLEPDNLDFRTRLAAVLMRAGRLDEALAAVRHSLQLKPGDMQALQTLWALQDRQGQPRDPWPAASAAPTTNDYSVTISARLKDQPIWTYLREYFGSVPLRRIDSVFAFTQFCRLYGGRIYAGPELTDGDLTWLYGHGIGYRMPLQGNVTTEADYAREQPFLARHHRKGNSVIVTTDALARWVRRDFPLYRIEASVIRGTDTADKLMRALEVFDTVVPLPEAFNTNFALLEGFEQAVKDRIRLFLNVACAYHCPARICYTAMARINRQEPNAHFECSQVRLSHCFTQGMIDFPMGLYQSMGYRQFKLLRVRGGRGTTGA